MQKLIPSVIPIRADIPLSEADQKVVDVAFNLWLERGFRGGSPIKDLLAAIQEVRGKASAGLFLLPKCNSRRRGLQPRTVLQRRLEKGSK